MKCIYLLIRVSAPLINLGTDLINLFIPRDKRVILMGAWMGDKLADNTRYLYEYLHRHKNEYEIKKMIWVTRDTKVYGYMRSKGYEVYMMHDIKSFYYHLKAGVHIVCNLSFPVKGYAGDIMGQLSGRAVKINTWHGISMKAGNSTGENLKRQGYLGQIKYFLRNNKQFYGFFSPGHWDKALYLSSGEEATQRVSKFCGVPNKNFIECGYPRNCREIKIHKDEEDVIRKIEKYKNRILYVPTFRKNGKVPHPLIDQELNEFLSRTESLWIEKPHSASKIIDTQKNTNENVLLLDSSFDMNVIIPYISIVITDYSSACYDAMYFQKPVIFYIPDYNEYLSKDRGFLFDFREMVRGVEAESVSQLITRLGEIEDNGAVETHILDKQNQIIASFFNKQSENMVEIIKGISSHTGVLNRV